MVFTDVPKEVFSFKIFGREFILLWMNRQEWICFTCPQEKENDRDERNYNAGYEDCAKEIRENEDSIHHT